MRAYFRSIRFGFGAAVIAAMACVAVFAYAGVHRVAAEPPVQTEIATAEDLLAIEAGSAGSYILVNDIEMSGVSWTPKSFNGVLDGNGHSINNLTVTACGAETVMTYDANWKEYDTKLAGLFTVLGKSAIVTNLTLNGVRVEIEGSDVCFIGGIAGYSDGAAIEHCNVNGYLSLSTSAAEWGLGGVLGYGYGTITGCDVSVVMKGMDPGRTSLDEQFLGGVCAGGYPSITGCNVSVDAHILEWGYGHNGGVLGMFMVFPKGNTGSTTVIKDNKISGKITYYKMGNADRNFSRTVIGELVSNGVQASSNTYNNKAVTINDRTIRSDVNYDEASLNAVVTPTAFPTMTPTMTPTATPTAEPTATPEPTTEPAETPTPTVAPTAAPTDTPVPTPTAAPTAEPTATAVPTLVPSVPGSDDTGVLETLGGITEIAVKVILAAIVVVLGLIVVQLFRIWRKS